MSLEVYSAQIHRGKHDPDFLDVSRASGTDGIFLAPSWIILSPVLAVRREAEKQLKASRSLPGDEGISLRMVAEINLEKSWYAYVEAYFAEMEKSKKNHPEEWKKLLSRPRVVLGCYCADREHCHTKLLRTEILPPMGAIDKGELE